MDRAVAKLHGQLYAKYFKGSTDAGSGRQVFWDVKVAPKFDFSPDALLDGKTLKVQFKDIGITIRSSKGEAVTTADATVWVTYVVEYPTGKPPEIKFSVKETKASTPKPDDQYILNAVVIPAMKKLAAQVMSAVQLPPIVEVFGQKFTLPEPFIIGDNFVFLANMLHRHFPLGFDATLPPGNPEAFAVLSPQLALQAWNGFNAATKDLKVEERRNGRVETPVQNIDYDAILQVKDIKGQILQGTEIPVTASVSGFGHVWANTALGTVDVPLTLTPQPQPSGKIGLGVVGNKVRAAITQIDSFQIQLDFTGSGIIDWLLNLFKGVFQMLIDLYTPWLRGYFLKLGYDVWTIPDLSWSYDGARLDIKLTDLRLSPYGSHYHVTGKVQL
jgi:hypothetical protein